MKAEPGRFNKRLLYLLLSCLILLAGLNPLFVLSEEAPLATPTPSPLLSPAPATAITETEPKPEIITHLAPLTPLATEAPEAFFQFQLGDKDVEFFLTGSWQASLRGSLGFMSRPETGFTALDVFPGITPGFYFEQTPVLTFSVWLMKQYFAEFSLLKDFKESAFLIGYEGKEAELIQHIYFGSQKINLEPYPFMVFPAQGESSLGAEAELKAANSRQQVLARFDNNDQGKKVFIGQNEVVEKAIPLYDYQHGRSFKLPDAGVTELAVYIEDAEASLIAADGKRYRPVKYDEANVDAETGIIFFKVQPTTRVLVYYTKNGYPIGTSGQGLGIEALATIDEDGIVDTSMPVDFNWNTNVNYPTLPAQSIASQRKITLGGRDCLLLWEPTLFSPFEIQSSYLLPEGTPAENWRTRITLVNSGTKQAISVMPLQYTLKPDEHRFTVNVTDELRNDLNNLYPFLMLDKRLYGPYAEKITGDYPYELLVQVFFPVSSYYLEPDILPGSVQIRKNGQDEARFSVDYDTGVLVFHTPIQALDRLEVTYKKRGALLNNGELLLAWGSMLDISDNLKLELATGLHWNFLPGAFSEKAYSHTGNLLSSAQLTGEFENINFKLAAGVSYNQPDTTGRLRLLGMEGSGLDVSLDETLAYLSAKPQQPNPVFTTTLGNRGKLFYKDYRKYEILGGYTLQTPDWSLPAEQLFAYADGSQPGPYQVAGSSNGSNRGQSLALDFEMGVTDNWVGCQIPLAAGESDLDLSSFKGLSLSYRAIDYNNSNNYDIYLQLGELDEDLDGDGQLDKESSASAGGFLFNDADNGVTLRVGGGPQLKGNLRLDSEDLNKNQALDPELSTHIYTVRLATVNANTNWQVVNCTFDNDMRKKLIRCRAVRLLLVNTSGTSCTGRLLVDRLSLAGTSWGLMNNTVNGHLSIKEIRENELASPPAITLSKAYDEINTIFHPSGQTQKVLEMKWDNYTVANDSWTARGFTQNGSEGAAYQEINLYLRLPALTAITACTPVLTFALLDAEGKGITWSWSVPETDAFSDWRKLTVNIPNRAVTLAGTQLTAATVQEDADYGSLNQLRVTVSNAQTGTLYLDELYLGSPNATWGGIVNLDAELQLPGPLLSVGEFPLLTDFSLTEHLQLAAPGFAPFYGRPYQNWLTSSLTEAAVNVLFCTLELNLASRGTDTDFNWEGGHRLTIPENEITSPLRFSDAYNLKQAVHGFDFDRSNSVEVDLPEFVHSSFRSDAAALDSFLTQTWEGKLVLPQPLLGKPGDSLLDAALSFSLSQEGYHPDSADYFTSWLTDYRLLLPWTSGELLERTGNLSLKLQSPPAVVQAQVWGEAGFHSADFKTASRVQANKFIYELSFPLLIDKDEQFYLTPGYRRSWSASSEESGLSDFRPDAELLFYRLSAQPYLFNQIPFYEFFASTTETVFQEQTEPLSVAHYEPKFWLTLNRRLSSRISDLFLPIKLDFNLTKTMDKENFLSQYLTKYNFTYKAQTINLFGEYGRYPVFSFYKIDEFMNSFNFNLTCDRELGLTSSEFILDSYMSFEGERHNLFTINNKWWLTQGETKKTEDELTIGFNWFMYPPLGTNLPFKEAFSFFKQPGAKEDFIAHEETISFIFKSSAETTSFHPFNLVITHKTTFQYPDHGFWGVKISLGMDKEDVFYSQEQEAIYRFMISIGLEGQMQF